MIEALEYITYAVAPAGGVVYSTLALSTKSFRPLKKIKADRAAWDAAIKAEAAILAEESGVKVGASKELALPADVTAPPVYESYDHPAPPILLLGTSLPKAPLGYGWEITTEPGGPEGNPHLKLSLLDLKHSVEVESIETDLVVARRWKYAADETYAQYYRKVENKARETITGYRHTDWGSRIPVYDTDATKAQGKVMMANLITPMVDWARVLVLRYIVERPDETKTNYMLISSEDSTDD